MLEMFTSKCLMITFCLAHILFHHNHSNNHISFYLPHLIFKLMTNNNSKKNWILLRRCVQFSQSNSVTITVVWQVTASAFSTFWMDGTGLKGDIY